MTLVRLRCESIKELQPPFLHIHARAIQTNLQPVQLARSLLLLNVESRTGHTGTSIEMRPDIGCVPASANKQKKK